MNKRKIGVFVGSLRKDSYSRQVANSLRNAAPESLELQFIEIGDLEMYNQDLDDENPPASWVHFRKSVKMLDAVLFVTPEYNRSIPAVLKNALDVGSRPREQNAWDGKPAAIVSVSPGALGAFGANHHLRQSLVFLNVPAMTQPEAYIGNVTALYDKEGKLINDKTRDFFRMIMEAFEGWIDKILGAQHDI